LPDGSAIDYAMLVKIYGESPEPEKRYSPAVCIACESKTISGQPDRKHVSTSYVERQNLTMRMHMRRFPRLTNAFSKKLENHVAAISLHFMFYNFVRIHQTLRITPCNDCWRDRSGLGYRGYRALGRRTRSAGPTGIARGTQ